METQMMASLKRASAEVVHNMSKEAAMRILVAERKTLRFQQELFATKEEALNMLLRLKQIMDSKIAEADKASLCQTRRVKELEAQLKEREDTVRDLRKELKITSDELEKIRRNQTQPSSNEQTSEEQSAPIHEDTCHENKLEASDSSLCPHMVVSDAKATTLTHRPCSELPAKAPDLASIIMRTKEPELYRNGYTQRIRAFEQNPLTGKLNILGKSDAQCLNSKYHSVDGVEQACTVTSPDEDVNCDKGQVVKFFRRCSSKQKARSKCDKNTMNMSPTNQVIGTSPCSCFNTVVSNGSPSRKICKEAEKDVDSHMTSISSGREKCSSQKNKDHNNASTRCDHPERHTGQGVGGGYIEDEKTIVEESQLMRQGCELVEDAVDVTPIGEDLEKIGVPSVMVSDSKDEKACKSISAPVQDANDRLLKYTFRRKRKRNLSGHNENVLVEKTNTSKRTAEKSGLVVESSRDNRRLAQVARQLISLSEKRWW